MLNYNSAYTKSYVYYNVATPLVGICTMPRADALMKKLEAHCHLHALASYHLLRPSTATLAPWMSPLQPFWANTLL